MEDQEKCAQHSKKSFKSDPYDQASENHFHCHLFAHQKFMVASFSLIKMIFLMFSMILSSENPCALLFLFYFCIFKDMFHFALFGMLRWYCILFELGLLFCWVPKQSYGKPKICLPRTGPFIVLYMFDKLTQ